ncbi:bifunctional methylenetetrahydrofolate dehydrogenase/methenyltetrahydrofolate cyclohydrolase FolD [Lichenihabitans psoromatis]|uniref:bifunctional methylenetetrahydrofolate dehydrogenase/methenyltetrahydrofolate cyclohydrolase FolD n=1 Tax=Lichenihabitans psoromatis TaxID=2528642 RepID=UPI00103837E0|nr:bifunctional methylenetetrahydrofolate dehydrogenase/methenyltetrahydrofolate cyclohydrolase FolD [Lichenihabitans psoromatis]
MSGARLIDGKAIAADVIARVTIDAAALLESTGTIPGLAVIIVGMDPASQVYVASKARIAEACGFRSLQHTLPESTSQSALSRLVQALNADPTIHGILIQLPLPRHLNTLQIIGLMLPEKDVDGLNEINAGRVALGDVERAFVPCTPAGSMVLIRSVMSDLRGLKAVVMGRSNLVGKPISSLLLAADCTVTVAHSQTVDLAEVCRQADVLVAAVGRPEIVKGDWIKPGAIVIDVGISRIPAEGINTRLVGDVAYAEAAMRASAITPVPGGVGPMTIAMLMNNTLLSAQRASAVLNK